MPARPLLDLAHRILPGAGAFGMEPPLCWVVPAGGALRRITLFLDHPDAQPYTFPDIQLIGRNGKAMRKEAVIERVTASAPHEGHGADNLRASFVAGRGIRSGIGIRPSMDVIFRGAVNLSEIRIANRGGVAGRAGRDLALRGYHGGRLVLSARSTDPRALVQAHRALCRTLGVPPPGEPLSPERQAGHAGAVRAAVIAELDKAEPALDPLTLLHLLPVFRHTGGLTPFQLRVAAEILTRIVGRDLGAKTRAFFPLSALLSTTGNLEAVVAEGNRLLSRRHGRQVAIVAGKHEFHESRLLKNRDRLLAALDRGFAALRECGVTPMLCYGSLLGAVREGSFIPHDDDVDILYHDGSRSREEMLVNLRALLQALGRAGYHTHLAGNGCHALVHDGGGVLDLFPCWEEAGRIHVLMGSNVYRPVSRAVMLPASEIALHGRRYPAPADPRALLAARYGSGWETPDPYHEWPWPILRTAPEGAGPPLAEPPPAFAGARGR